MGTTAQTCFATALVVVLGAGVSGCATLTQSDLGTDTALTSCDEIMPERMMPDILGTGGRLAQLQAEEPDAVSPLVDRMVTDGIACGGRVNGAVDGTVLIGQLATNQKQWESIQTVAFYPVFPAEAHAEQVRLWLLNNPGPV